MEIRRNTTKIGRFYNKLKQFIEGDSLNYKIVFIFITITIGLLLTLTYSYIKYDGIYNMFSYNEIIANTYYSKFILERVCELTIAMFCFSMSSIFIVSMLMAIFEFVILAIKKIEDNVIRVKN